MTEEPRADAEIRLIPNDIVWSIRGSERLGALVGEHAEASADLGAAVILQPRYRPPFFVLVLPPANEPNTITSPSRSRSR